jgi:purine-nucleoside phosphorylase
MSDNEVITRAQIEEAAQAVAARSSCHPQVGLILGSGLNALADEIEAADRVPYAELPGFARPSVEGHSGRLVLGQLAGQSVVIMQGRAHAYEGISPQRATFPVRVMHMLGVRTLIVTNAAGGLNPTFGAGDLMLITDHIGLAAMTGLNPLWGANDESLGPRFVDMSNAYDRSLRELALNVAGQLNIPLRQGVYVGLSGPTFETPAEVRFLRMIGGDAVGMSTVPEVLVARHMEMRVLGISAVSNLAIDRIDSGAVTNHEEVLTAGRNVGPKLMALLRGVLANL